MFFNKTILSLISVLLIGFTLSSCVTYNPRVVKTNRRINYYKRDAHLIWPGSIDSGIYIKDISFTGNTLCGTAYQKPASQSPKHDGYQANIYLDSSVAPPDSLPGTFKIDSDKILKLEVYDDSVGKVVMNIFLSTVAIGVAVMLIILATKESCPFIYSFNGSTYDFIGEIYSGAILPGLERDDYLPLTGLKQVNQSYQLKMTNEVQEIQHTNMTQLLVVDHPTGTNVLIDKYGQCQSLQSLQAPRVALDAFSQDILPQICSKDSLKYVSNSYIDTKVTDEMYLSFDRPQNMNKAKLVYRGKNSFWLDYTMGQFFNMFGSKYAKWFKKQKTSKHQLQPNWALEQGIPLSVYIRQNGEWQFVDYFNVVGPMAEKDMVMSIDISHIESDIIELKLESAFLFWETDYIGMDFSSQINVYQKEVPVSNAISHDAKDLTKLLQSSDNKYFTMPQIGNYAIMNFAIPEPHQNCDRTVFLHSRGHYEVIRKPTGKPNVQYLESFRQPGMMGQYSRELYRQKLNMAGK